jgi:hypothetical protein
MKFLIALLMAVATIVFFPYSVAVWLFGALVAFCYTVIDPL